MSGGFSLPEASGATAIASYCPSPTQFIAAWCAVASSTVEYQTPTMCLPDCHSASLALPSPITARHCAPTRFSAVMPTVQPSRDAWPTTWSKVWIDCGRRMRGIASISSRFAKSFIAKTNERNFNRRSRSAVILAQSCVSMASLMTTSFGQSSARDCVLAAPAATSRSLFLVHDVNAVPIRRRIARQHIAAIPHHGGADVMGPEVSGALERHLGAVELAGEIRVERALVEVPEFQGLGAG